MAWLLEEATRQPVLAVWEDLHWADPTALEMLGLLVRQTPTAAMLHVLTFRPGFSPPWPTRSHLTPITLNRLGRPPGGALIAAWRVVRRCRPRWWLTLWPRRMACRCMLS